MLPSAVDWRKYVTATVASPFVSEGNYYVSEKLQLSSLYFLSMMEWDRGEEEQLHAFLTLTLNVQWVISFTQGILTAGIDW